jgi:hypothetical protein
MPSAAVAPGGNVLRRNARIPANTRISLRVFAGFGGIHPPDDKSSGSEGAGWGHLMEATGNSDNQIVFIYMRVFRNLIEQDLG